MKELNHFCNRIKNNRIKNKIIFLKNRIPRERKNFKCLCYFKMETEINTKKINIFKQRK